MAYKHERIDEAVKLLIKNMAFLRALEKKITSPNPDSIDLDQVAQSNQQAAANVPGMDFSKKKSLQDVLNTAPDAIEKAVNDMQSIVKRIATTLF